MIVAPWTSNQVGWVILVRIVSSYCFPYCVWIYNKDVSSRPYCVLKSNKGIYRFLYSLCFPPAYVSPQFHLVKCFIKKCPQNLYSDFADREFYASVRFMTEARWKEMLLCGQHSLIDSLSRHFVEFLQECEHHEGADKTESNQNAPVVHQRDAVPKHWGDRA